MARIRKEEPILVAPWYDGKQLPVEAAATSCPHCSKRWQWDWELDEFVDPSSRKLCEGESYTLNHPNGASIAHYSRCTCGCVLSVQVTDNFGCSVFIQDRYTY